MKNLKSLSNTELVLEAEKKIDRLEELSTQSHRYAEKSAELNQKLRKIQQEGKSLQKEFDQILKEAKNRNIQIN